MAVRPHRPRLRPPGSRTFSQSLPPALLLAHRCTAAAYPGPGKPLHRRTCGLAGRVLGCHTHSGTGGPVPRRTRRCNPDGRDRLPGVRAVLRRGPTRHGHGRLRAGGACRSAGRGAQTGAGQGERSPGRRALWPGLLHEADRTSSRGRRAGSCSGRATQPFAPEGSSGRLPGPSRYGIGHRVGRTPLRRCRIRLLDAAVASPPRLQCRPTLEGPVRVATGGMAGPGRRSGDCGAVRSEPVAAGRDPCSEFHRSGRTGKVGGHREPSAAASLCDRLVCGCCHCRRRCTGSSRTLPVAKPPWPIRARNAGSCYPGRRRDQPAGRP